MKPVSTATLDAALDRDDAVVLDFTAPWCTACKALKPTLLDLEARHGVDVLQIDVEDSPELGERFSVTHLPTLIVLKRGEVAARHVGASRRPVIEALFVGAKS